MQLQTVRVYWEKRTGYSLSHATNLSICLSVKNQSIVKIGPLENWGFPFDWSTKASGPCSLLQTITRRAIISLLLALRETWWWPHAKSHLLRQLFISACWNSFAKGGLRTLSSSVILNITHWMGSSDRTNKRRSNYTALVIHSEEDCKHVKTCDLVVAARYLMLGVWYNVTTL